MAPGAVRRSIVDRVRDYFVEPAAAEVAIEFTSEAIVGARTELRRGGAEVRALASEPLPPRAFAPSISDPGFADREAMRESVKRLADRLGVAPGARTAIVVPDVAARFRLFTPAELEGESTQREAIVAFRMQKLLPFPPAESRVVASWPRSTAQPVLAIGFSATVVAAYEQIGEGLDLDVGSIETSSMALLSLAHGKGDALVVRHDPACLTLMIVRDGWPAAIRSFDAATAGSVLEVRREIAATAVFFKDRLQGARLDKAMIHGTEEIHGAIQAAIQDHFGIAAGRARLPPTASLPGLPSAVERQAVSVLALLGVGASA